MVSLIINDNEGVEAAKVGASVKIFLEKISEDEVKFGQVMAEVNSISDRLEFQSRLISICLHQKKVVDTHQYIQIIDHSFSLEILILLKL